MEDARLIVAKAGTAVLTSKGRPDTGQIRNLVSQIADVRSAGVGVVLVSSGAVAFGREQFQGIGNWPSLEEETVRDRQVAAAFGQPLLMAEYNRAFSRHNLLCAQVLVTNNQFRSANHASELSVNISRILERGVPVLNENDVLTSEELDNNFSDNDQLTVKIVKLIEADAAILLTDVQGFLRNGEVVEELLGDEVCRPTTGGTGRGGMMSKLASAHEMMRSGVHVYIADGHLPGVIRQIVIDGKNPGSHGGPIV